MPVDNMLARPNIVIYAADFDGVEQKIREIQAGIEEEGIPYMLIKGEQLDAADLAWQGAAVSQLGVGLGISLKGICVHFHKLPQGEPLFISSDIANPAVCRQFGYNGARLVKGLPFKEQKELCFTKDWEKEQLVEQIRQIVAKILEEDSKGHGR